MAAFPQTGCVNGCIAVLAQPVPEPSSITLALAGLLAVVGVGVKTRRKDA